MSGTIHAPDHTIHNAAIPDLQRELVEVWYGILTAARAERAGDYEAGSSDVAHRCLRGWVDDRNVPTEHNEHGDRWCGWCGERILVAPQAER